jgi:hypothetical protein
VHDFAMCVFADEAALSEDGLVLERRLDRLRGWFRARADRRMVENPNPGNMDKT